ncbi:hypothetical protein [Streptomyces sp. A0592]|uniref:hypothetical protein n=1 Tax=Streptomyces sp. A0592 TaxID=2563099 RepID=UPI00109EC8FC|nr:hypothetical protein [Streptomyces sp. A0592]THA83243.1 hypothetical protein E6U81_17345 [Streptomyces sp. A0592]
MRSTSRTTFRTAAVVAGAATVLALPVGSAFADSPAVPRPEVLPGVEQPSVRPSVGPEHGPAPQVRAFVTAVKLADGCVAKIYKIGKSHFEADILAGSTKLDTLVSRGGAASYGQSNGLHVVLQPNGTVTSWLDGAPKPKPAPRPAPDVDQHVKVVSSVRVALPDGRIAKLVDGPRGKYVVISTPNGHVLGTVDLKRPSAQNDGWTYRLVRDGKRVKFVVIDGKSGGNSWVYGFDGRLIERYTVDAPQPRKDRVRVAAGTGGMAASGPAGLGFAVVPAQG